MKHYNSYISHQEISRETHERLLELEARRRPGRLWVKYGALAACAALIVGVGVWRLVPAPDPADISCESGQFAADYTPLPGQSDTVGPEDHPLRDDLSQADDTETSFVVNSPAQGGKQPFPMVPAILYPENDRPDIYASAPYAPGSFTVDLTKGDIQTVFWGPQGKPEAGHPKLEQGDLPWALFWDGYTVCGCAWYDGQGRLMELRIFGENGGASFTLALCPDSLPYADVIYADYRNKPDDVFGVSVSSWSGIYDRDGSGETDYICTSEFMTADGIGVRFENRNSSIRAEYGGDKDMELGGAKTFNALFVRQAIAGGLYLDQLMTTESVPAWREEEFSSQAQARQVWELAEETLT